MTKTVALKERRTPPRRLAMISKIQRRLRCQKIIIW